MIGVITDTNNVASLRKQARMYMSPGDESSISLSHQLINGDALVQKNIPEASVDLTVTSPPYNVSKTYTEDSADDGYGLSRVSRFHKENPQ